MSEAKLALIRSAMNAPGSSAASGLRNVNRRVQLYYGREYGIRIQSAPGRGTTVELAVPGSADPGCAPCEPSRGGAEASEPTP
jgi:sensor histidine kinase YesM